MSPVSAAIALFFAVGLCLLGEVLRMSVPGLRKLLVPGAVLGGLLALAAGPQGLALTTRIGAGPDTYGTLGQFPPLFITVVFAALMLGRPIRNFGAIWNRARPQIVMGHVYAWGQYVVGLVLLLLVLVPLLGVDPLAACSIAIGFQGGHGTAAGLDETFRSLGFPEGKTYAYTLATFGIVAGTVLGPLLANFHRSRHDLEEECGPSGDEVGGGEGEEAPHEGKPPVEFSPLTGALTLHAAILGLVILAGYGVLQGAVAIESAARPEATPVSSYIPLFSVVLVVGVLAQILLQATNLDDLLNRHSLRTLSAFALDMVIVSALATLDLSVVASQWKAIAVLCLGGLAWNMAVYVALGPRVYARPWHAYGLGDLGGGTATTATGLLLIRVVDPRERTQATLAYTEKQPFYEPFMGGGLVTAFALPVLAAIGAGATLALTASVLALWLGYAVLLARRRRDRRET